MLLGMERSWHLVLMSEGTKEGWGKVLPHTSPARPGDEPRRCGNCTHWTWGTFANNKNQMVLELFNTNFQQLLVSPLSDCTQAKPYLIISSSVLISRIFMSLLSSLALSTENWAVEKSWVLLKISATVISNWYLHIILSAPSPVILSFKIQLLLLLLLTTIGKRRNQNLV